MQRRLPSLNALKAFEAAARHESFTKAADELAVTQGAVSHQVKGLEAELGLKLFNRERQRLVITEAGRGYLEVVRDAFDRLATGTERLLQVQKSGALTVTTSPNFAAKWLVHRLGRFVEAHPDIDLRVAASHRHIDFAREDIDMAVRHGDGQWPGLSVTRLCVEEIFPVCNPELLRGRRSPVDLAHHTLLHVNDRRDWSKCSTLPAWRRAPASAGRSSIRSAWRSMPQSTAKASRWRVLRSRPGTCARGGWCAHSRSR
jgi:LysR family glycine cleavage system transcriptional activator